MAIDASLIGDPHSLKNRKVTLQVQPGNEIDGEILLAHEDERGVHLKIRTPIATLAKELLWRSLGFTERAPDGTIRLGLNKGEVFTIHADQSNLQGSRLPELALPA